MTDTTNNLVPNKGKLWRFVAAVGAWLQALEYTSFDYTQTRIDRLERKVVELTEDLRQSRASTLVTWTPMTKAKPRPNMRVLSAAYGSVSAVVAWCKIQEFRTATKAALGPFRVLAG